MAPAFNRPQAAPLVQRKPVSPAPPTVYRPQQPRVGQPKLATPVLPPTVIQRSGGKKTKEEEEKKARRRERYTRIIRVDQLNKRKIGIKTTRKSRGSLRRNLPEEFNARGKHSTKEKGLYTFMRRYGGAGIQGVHRGVDGQSRARVVRSVLSKMAQDPKRKHGRRGPKFAMIGIDSSRLNSDQLLDTTSAQVRRQFSRQYGGPNSGSGKNYMRMFGRHADEGVVGVIGTIPLDAIMGLRAFRGVPTEEELEEIIEELVMSESEEEDDDNLSPDCSGGGGFNFGPGFPPPGGGMGGGMGGGPGITAF